MKHNLLLAPLLSWRGRDRITHRVTLPGLLAALAREDVVDFPRARAHQQHPWSMFLTQLAAIAMKRGGAESPPVGEAAWTALLLRETGGEPHAWCLVVDDLSKPAFFQPPVPEGELRKPASKNAKTGKTKPGDEWSACEAPDDLDILVTSKRHDVKSSLVSAADLEAWAYALCSLQTMQGFPGRGYNPISRMNGGYGNRPRVGLSPTMTFSQRFQRDLLVLRDEWPTLVDRGFSDSGVGLVWTESWDGEASLALGRLCPHFVEVCWRVRLTGDEASLVARYTTTSSRRCAPEIAGGDVGDPWAPVARKDGKLLTPGSSGYRYALLVELIFGTDYAPAAAQELRAQDADSVLLWASALARGQGKTGGLHERIVPVPRKARRLLGQKDTRAALGKRAVEWVRRASELRSKVLFPSLRLLALGETVPPDRLDARIDERFFPTLFASVELDDTAAVELWDDTLVKLALGELQRAIRGASLADARYWRATTAALRMFYGCLKKRFPDAFARLHAAHVSDDIPAEGVTT